MPPPINALLVLPRLRVQNANAISSPLTWGFPAMSAFLGFMTALERRLGRDAGIEFYKLGVICHGFEAQVTTEGYTRAFHLTRNPVLADGSTAGIVEEGRVHLEITLVFDVVLTAGQISDAERQALAEQIAHLAAGMRLAGGSVMPALPMQQRRVPRPALMMLQGDPDAQRQQFRRMARRWLPGFALVSRDDLLSQRLTTLQAEQPDATTLDAWLDLSRLNHRAVQATNDKGEDTVSWVTDPREGWTVPIPVGYAGLSELHEPGSVANARDRVTPFRFVDSIWSIGQWISPHRLQDLDDLFWYAQPTDEGVDPRLYRCRNKFKPATPTHADEAQAVSDTVAA
ncbi:type I-F CRISPR-associated protein Csy2 [Roseateles koreensis]|uniref:Type I-F CRISPR-associated protein Csy2 n=1 Tax=Roseateles koreensis TaxID=2987526 RepID=A0ABT5KNF8_9BURK|nr:type I-F CRISPR-associated protein Csy2 [Roseateles koreensis]MDC8784381.1 type I-F CRISPR-associated protein Csy2 [Roseateles koreensis]